MKPNLLYRAGIVLALIISKRLTDFNNVILPVPFANLLGAGCVSALVTFFTTRSNQSYCQHRKQNLFHTAKVAQ